MVSLLKEQTLSFSEASRLIPGRPHINTVRRWATSGLNNVRLRSVKMGGKRFTTVEAVEEFIAALTGQPDPIQRPVVSPAHQVAESKLDAMGV